MLQECMGCDINGNCCCVVIVVIVVIVVSVVIVVIVVVALLIIPEVQGEAGTNTGHQLF